MRGFSSYQVTYYDQVSQENSSIFSFGIALFFAFLNYFMIIQVEIHMHMQTHQFIPKNNYLDLY